MNWEFTKGFKEKEWKMYDDAYALLRAQEVLDDPNRNKNAKKMAEKMAKETAKEAGGLMKVAAEALQAVESIIVGTLVNLYESNKKELPENFEEQFKAVAKKAMAKKGWNKKKAVGLGVAIGKKLKEKAEACSGKKKIQKKGK